ncbi:MAG: 1-phosphofructokinase family hexose kinase [Erysipelotrichaceae bacterium]|nr:1-phosphofructokinase family hexose kinase [Erysipelotrichaceae bacterium]
MDAVFCGIVLNVSEGLSLNQMIVTITCNPAIDRSITDKGEYFSVGGKGINVSKVLKNVGTDSIASGFIGKDNKDIVYDYLDSIGVRHNFIEIEGKVRTNTKKIVDGDLEEHNEEGPLIDDISKEKLKDYCRTLRNDIVVISGSAPKNIGDDYYYQLIKILKENDNYVIVDCDKNLLKEAVKAKPDVIKPNIKEFERLFDKDMNEEDIIYRAKNLGIKTVCVSMGSKGALFIGEKVIRCKPLSVNFVSPLGAGDSMVAAFAYSKDKNLDYIDTIRNAMAFSAAQCETEGSEPFEKDRMVYYRELIDYQEVPDIR